MIIDYCEQPSEEWKKKKAGTPSASNFDKIITSTGAASKQSKGYMGKLLAEWFIGEPIEGYQNRSMERGIELEAEARSLYEMINDVEVKQVGLVYKDSDKLVLCSPDGLTNYDVKSDSFKKGYETKCPEPHTHVEYLLTNKMPSKYKAQVQGSMYVTGLDYWDFMSYCPGMPPLIIRIERDTRFIKLLSDEIDCFVEEMLEKRLQLEALK